jgi:hypothetical protein
MTHRTPLRADRQLAALLAAITAILLAAACAWWDERAAIRERLDACRDLANTPASDGIGTMTRAGEIGRCFTDDVTVDLGRGAAPISGREMLMGMAARLLPRTSEYRLEFADLSVALAPDEQSATVRLTAEFIKREPGSRQSMDAREFELAMRREDEEWRIARVTAIQTLR